ncbi:MAG: tyrosine--tRNA ligase [Pseudomonadota bacterium]|nr:tyrosine--tRNA ligase [Pseudomonadota bacterium]
MNKFKSDFLSVLAERGFIHQLSDPQGLDQAARSGPITAYIGFDCTAPSLHAGSLVQIMLLYWLQQTGHRPIALMGGGTSKVGDPSGRDDSRKMLSSAEIAANMQGIRAVFEKFMRFGSGAGDAIMADNADWLDALNYIDFLRDFGAHFSVNRMLSFESVRLRLDREQPLSLLEFNYMVLQAYDFLELARRHCCILQMGGSDQWGNIVNGIELGRRADGLQLHGLTTPLLTTSSGAKMGKTAAGAVWLNADSLTPYGYWQYWRNTEDADVGRFLKLFTTLPINETNRLAALRGSEINEAKKRLATETTALVHGREAAANAEETARRAFEEGAADAGLPTLTVRRQDLSRGLGLLKTLVDGGFAGSNSEARRAVQGGAVRINDELVADDRTMLGDSHLTEDGVIKLSVGKKKHMLVKPD